MENKAQKANKLKDTIKEMKKTSKGKATLRLIKWLIFFFFIFVFIIICSFIQTPNVSKNNPNINPINPSPDSNEKIEPPNDEPIILQHLDIETTKKYLENLKNQTYTYQINININNVLYTFNGVKEPTIETGYKETSSGIIKYVIDGTGIYQEIQNERVPLYNLYEGLNPEYMNWDSFFNFFCMEYDLQTENTYYMASEINDYYLTIKDDNISNIKVISRDSLNDNFYSYDFTFKIEANHD